MSDQYSDAFNKIIEEQFAEYAATDNLSLQVMEALAYDLAKSGEVTTVRHAALTASTGFVCMSALSSSNGDNGISLDIDISNPYGDDDEDDDTAFAITYDSEEGFKINHKNGEMLSEAVQIANEIAQLDELTEAEIELFKYVAAIATSYDSAKGSVFTANPNALKSIINQLRKTVDRLLICTDFEFEYGHNSSDYRFLTVTASETVASKRHKFLNRKCVNFMLSDELGGYVYEFTSNDDEVPKLIGKLLETTEQEPNSKQVQFDVRDERTVKFINGILRDAMYGNL